MLFYILWRCLSAGVSLMMFFDMFSIISFDVVLAFWCFSDNAHQRTSSKTPSKASIDPRTSQDFRSAKNEHVFWWCVLIMFLIVFLWFCLKCVLITCLMRFWWCCATVMFDLLFDCIFDCVRLMMHFVDVVWLFVWCWFMVMLFKDAHQKISSKIIIKNIKTVTGLRKTCSMEKLRCFLMMRLFVPLWCFLECVFDRVFDVFLMMLFDDDVWFAFWWCFLMVFFYGVSLMMFSVDVYLVVLLMLFFGYDSKDALKKIIRKTPSKISVES